jgi:hypothetical protein
LKNESEAKNLKMGSSDSDEEKNSLIEKSQE